MVSTNNRDPDGFCVTCKSGPSQQHTYDCEWYNNLVDKTEPTPEDEPIRPWHLRPGKIQVLEDDGPLTALAAEIHATNISKGWWDEERSVAEMLIQVHGEVSEAWEDWRIGREDMTFAVNSAEYPRGHGEEVGLAFRTFVNWANAHATPHEGDIEPLPAGTMETLVNAGVAEPIGMEVEIADVIIRCLDILASRGVDIDKVVRTKMIYNKTRAHRHGGKRA